MLIVKVRGEALRPCYCRRGYPGREAAEQARCCLLRQANQTAKVSIGLFSCSHICSNASSSTILGAESQIVHSILGFIGRYLPTSSETPQERRVAQDLCPRTSILRHSDTARACTTSKASNNTSFRIIQFKMVHSSTLLRSLGKLILLPIGLKLHNQSSHRSPSRHNPTIQISKTHHLPSHHIRHISLNDKVYAPFRSTSSQCNYNRRIYRPFLTVRNQTRRASSPGRGDEQLEPDS